MKNLTFLTTEQIFGEYGYNQLDIFKKYGVRSAPTDFAILLGCHVSSQYYTSDGHTLKDRAGDWWAIKPYVPDTHYLQRPGAITVQEILDNGNMRWWPDHSKRTIGARPAMYYPDPLYYINLPFNSQGVKEVVYGNYPQTIEFENISYELETAYKDGSLKNTGYGFTTDSVNYQDNGINFRSRIHIEYEYKGNKYIRFVGDKNSEGEMLSDGRIVKSGNAYWVRVEPITWLVDERSGMAVSKKILFAGVQFNQYDGLMDSFDESDIKIFMDEYFSKEIIYIVTLANYYPRRLCRSR